MFIKIFTYHNTINIGAILQSRTLKDFIEKETSIYTEYHHFQPKKILYAEYVKPLITKNFYKFKNTIFKNFKIYNWKRKLKNNYSRNLKKKETNNFISIYGSDEIWNLQNHYYGYDPHFFGFNNNTKKISYAASFGKSKLELINKIQREELNKLLGEFENISVRDENSSNIVKKLIGYEPPIVLDPVFLSDLPILEDKSLFDQRIEKDFAIIYGDYFLEYQKKIILDFCKRRNLDLISISYYSKWVEKNYINIDPTVFFQLFKNSKFVFTSMFHGVMFSIKLKKQFYYSIDPIRLNKISYIINELKLNSREINEFNKLDNEINYDEIYKLFVQWLNNSKSFLINSINKNIK